MKKQPTKTKPKKPYSERADIYSKQSNQPLEFNTLICNRLTFKAREGTSVEATQ